MAKGKEGERSRMDAFETTGDPSHLVPQETQRRVYALPAEMVERIVEFQKDKGLPSEVEAVRRLLDEALQHRDNLEKIINRYVVKLSTLKIASEAAKEVLVGHPLVEKIQFDRDSITFELRDGWVTKITEKGEVTIWDQHRSQWYWHAGYNKDVPGYGYMSEEDLPF